MYPSDMSRERFEQILPILEQARSVDLYEVWCAVLYLLRTGLAATTAQVTDRQGVLQSQARCSSSLGQVQSLLCDSGYTEQIAKRNFAWLEKNRRLWKNCERKLNTSFINASFFGQLNQPRCGSDAASFVSMAEGPEFLLWVSNTLS